MPRLGGGASDFTTRAIPVAAFPTIGICNLDIEKRSSSIFSIHPKNSPLTALSEGRGSKSRMKNRPEQWGC